MTFHSCFRTPYHKEMKSLTCGYLKGFKVENNFVKGTVKLQNIRFYFGSYVEVEVLFEGKLKARYFKVTDWFGTELLDFERISKIKINRKIKKSIYDDLRRKLKFFDINLTDYSQIKKIKWN